ncbi:hypothetical protein [Cellulomonas dongxiuzhuiae]|uniref:Uncharacterized protein n=1 Tax=Cellulomonas dongxiuzhuiae TaxID=2819979 RepID=A0ABX8GJ93_9CELL|nr:hypothetical protein [Cellulomonas dongxiuzhuiae]MBO3094884.1 hypothetical protein [Cellulomonas dongxiuzhuiae]QWC15913.1 hypothetical protein KKR89_16935 [Cellulomonas dongxiuzhuiae]
MARRAGVAPDDVVGFLAVHGRDTAGALALVPEGAAPDRPRVPLRMLDDGEIGALLEEATEQGTADQPTSIVGLEPKIVLAVTADGFALPTPTGPSTDGNVVLLAPASGSRRASDLRLDHSGKSMGKSRDDHLDITLGGHREERVVLLDPVVKRKLIVRPGDDTVAHHRANGLPGLLHELDTMLRIRRMHEHRRAPRSRPLIHVRPARTGTSLETDREPPPHTVEPISAPPPLDLHPQTDVAAWNRNEMPSQSTPLHPFSA